VEDRKNFSFRSQVFDSFKRPAKAGIIVLTPFLATLIFFKWVLGFFSQVPGMSLVNVTSYGFLNQFLRLGAILTILGVSAVAVGKIFSTDRGRKCEERLDALFCRLPLAGTVYSVTKTAADTVFEKKEDFEEPVKISHGGLRFTAFQTGNNASDGRKMVFVPTSPNITSGFVIEVDEDSLEKTDESLEQAFTKVLSAGFSD
jgi:uncharacterized membrane protein